MSLNCFSLPSPKTAAVHCACRPSGILLALLAGVNAGGFVVVGRQWQEVAVVYPSARAINKLRPTTRLHQHQTTQSARPPAVDYYYDYLYIAVGKAVHCPRALLVCFFSLSPAQQRRSLPCLSTAKLEPAVLLTRACRALPRQPEAKANLTPPRCTSTPDLTVRDAPAIVHASTINYIASTQWPRDELRCPMCPAPSTRLFADSHPSAESARELKLESRKSPSMASHQPRSRPSRLPRRMKRMSIPDGGVDCR